MYVELSDNLAGSHNGLSVTACSGTDLEKETGREADMESKGSSPVSGEGAKSGEGGDVPSSMLCKDTTCGGLLCVLVVLTSLSSSLSSSLWLNTFR